MSTIKMKKISKQVAKDAIKQLAGDLVAKTSDKIVWGDIQHGHDTEKKKNIMRMLIHKLAEIIYEGNPHPAFGKPLDQMNQVERTKFRKDCDQFIKSWDKICKRMGL
jgi:hypothetical protein